MANYIHVSKILQYSTYTNMVCWYIPDSFTYSIWIHSNAFLSLHYHHPYQHLVLIYHRKCESSGVKNKFSCFNNIGYHVFIFLHNRTKTIASINFSDHFWIGIDWNRLKKKTETHVNIYHLCGNYSNLKPDCLLVIVTQSCGHF